MTDNPGIDHQPIHPRLFNQARYLMKSCDFDLYEAAHAIQVRPRDLDLALWRYVGELPKFTWRD